jgi:hypothetical protein
MPDEILLSNINIINSYNVLNKNRGALLSKKHLRIVKLITQFEREQPINYDCLSGKDPNLMF